jgi:hypothetical protein
MQKFRLLFYPIFHLILFNLNFVFPSYFSHNLEFRFGIYKEILSINSFEFSEPKRLIEVSPFASNKGK